MKKLLLLFIILGGVISLHAQVPKTVALTAAGTLSSTLTADELSTVTNLTLTGNIDARDFRTMRDLMPILAEIDLSGASIVAYSGMEGTSITGNTSYPANTIPETAFMNASYKGKSSLTIFKFPNTFTDVGFQAFRGCVGLTSITLPPSTMYVYSYAFAGCTRLTSVSIPASVSSIGTYAFGDSPVAFSVDINNNFYSSENGILFNKAKTYLFQSPPSISGNYVIPSTVETIGGYAFSRAERLNSIMIPASVKYIREGAFTACTGLTSIQFPISVITIENWAFQSCSGLISVAAPWMVPLKLGTTVFANIDKSSCILKVPFGTISVYQAADQWKDFQNIIEMEPAALTYVPDDNFEQALIDLGYDFGVLDNYVPTANISTLTTLSLQNKNITDLTGIGDFTKLEKLYLSGNKLTSLDLSQNALLKVLHCQNNQLTSLDVSKNSALTEIAPNYNQLTSLDLSKNTALIKVFCQSNKLTQLDVSNSKSLMTLSCSANQLTSLDVSYNPSLVALLTDNNKLYNLDISKNILLTKLDCSNNLITTLNIKNGNNANMIGQYNGLNASNNPNLLCIQVDNPSLAATYANWLKDPIASYSSDCSPKTYIPDDNFEQALINLGLDSGPLDDYVPTANIASVTSLDVSGEGIDDLSGIQDFVSLQQLNCGSNNLTTIDISKNVNLQTLFIYFNQLTSLDVSNNTNLQQLYGNNNFITALDLSKNSELNTLDFGNNKLTSLDLSKNPLLTILNCTYNQISNIDLTNNANLEQIGVGGNPISSLDISRNLNLKWFYVYSTNLEKIDCSNNKGLESIDCSRNSRLTSLNLKNENNPILKNVFAIENPLLSCIQVDDPTVAVSYTDWKVDAQAGYSNNCAVPVANAGVDQNVNVGASVILDGSLSFDLYGDQLTYFWTASSGIILNLENPARPTFVAPNVNRERSFSFNLVVSDGLVNSIADAISVTVKPINTAPILVLNSLTVKLDASGNYNLSLIDLKSLVAGTTDDKDSFKNLKIAAEPSTFSCQDIGNSVNVKITVTDSEGAYSSGYSLINVLDVTPPTFSSITKNYSAVILSGENYILPDFSKLYPATDACSKVTYTQTPVPGTIYTNSTKEIINLKAEDEFGNITQLSISFTLAVRSKLKSADINLSNEICGTPVLEVYPNPFKDRVYFVLTSPKETNAILEIYSSNGTKLKTLFSGKITENQKYNLEFAPKEMPSQILFYKLLLDNKLTTGKLILDK